MRYVLVLLLLLAGPVWGQEFTPLKVDLNGDGTPELIKLRPFKQGGVTLGQLVVTSAAGKLLWEGPRHSATPWYPREPLIFLGDFDRGVPEAAGDFDGDGSVDYVVVLSGEVVETGPGWPRAARATWSMEPRSTRPRSSLGGPMSTRSFPWVASSRETSWPEPAEPPKNVKKQSDRGPAAGSPPP